MGDVIYKWKYKTYKVTKGKYDGALLRIPEFFENSSLYSAEKLGLSNRAFDEYVNFYIDVLTVIFGYIDSIRVHPRALDDVRTVRDIRKPTWMIRFLNKSIKDHNYTKAEFKDDQLNQLAIIIGLHCVVSNMTPYNNEYLKYLNQPVKDSDDGPLNLTEG